ncbi:MAG TPA: elongation factor Ts [Acidimicrobiia bacterium]|nr:elongation factor Ts [Acidimicrobiia bacterium]
MMDAKKALDDASGDFEKASELLRERGLAKMAKRADRDANEGTIGFYLHHQNDHPVMGVIVELACETDFVAKSPDFNDVADDLALHISWGNPTWVRREDVAADALAKEADLVEREAKASGKPEQAIPKIIEGRLEKWFEDHVLYEQTFVNKEKFDGTIAELINQLGMKMGENISVRRFYRVEVGASV